MALVTRRIWPLIQTLKAVGIVVTAIALVAVDAADGNPCKPFEIGDDGTERMAVVRVAMQGFGMQHELPAFGRSGWRSDRDLAAELVGGTGLSFADALNLGRVQRIDLRPALTLLLMAHTQRQIEQRAEAVFERCVALDLAADVTDDAAEPRVQELQLPPGPLELMGMRIAPDHDGGALGQPQIAL